MKKVFNEFTIALLLLTAITGVMFISCSDDEDDKRYSQNTETSTDIGIDSVDVAHGVIPNWEDSSVTEYNYKTMPLNYYLAGIWDEISTGSWSEDSNEYGWEKPSPADDTSALILSPTLIISYCWRHEVNWNYTIINDDYIDIDFNTGRNDHFKTHIIRISENEMIFSAWVPCMYQLSNVPSVKFRRSGK